MMKNLTVIIALYFLFQSSSFLWAQNEDYSFKKLGTKEGLSQGHVQCIMQDSKGYIWIGTQEGLNRYDGYNFRVYRNDNKDSTSICGDRIEAIVEDKEGLIWIITYFDGVSYYDRTTDEFTQFKTNPQYNTKQFLEGSGLSIDKNNDLWIFYRNGIGRYNRKTKQITYHPSNTLLQGNYRVAR
jgi:ligand-binding sensor domain-containing protein